MPRFFCENINENNVVITGQDAKHISRVLRMKQGETLVLCDGNGIDYYCKINDISEDIKLSVVEKKKNESEPDVYITLYQAIPKGDKLDFIVQKAVELGAKRIVPVMTKYCVSRPKPDAAEKKTERLNKIALEASKQCGRAVVPVVESFIDFNTAIKRMAKERSMVFYEGGGEKVYNIVSCEDKKISIFIGSEGGFSEEEINSCKSCGITPATLGKLILRCETAPICALTLVMNATGNI